ncbi:hypothetical protein JCM1841_000688 [Sporobolomyces salmonicolor]
MTMPSSVASHATIGRHTPRFSFTTTDISDLDIEWLLESSSGTGGIYSAFPLPPSSPTWDAQSLLPSPTTHDHPRSPATPRVPLRYPSLSKLAYTDITPVAPPAASRSVSPSPSRAYTPTPTSSRPSPTRNVRESSAFLDFEAFFPRSNAAADHPVFPTFSSARRKGSDTWTFSSSSSSSSRSSRSSRSSGSSQGTTTPSLAGFAPAVPPPPDELSSPVRSHFAASRFRVPTFKKSSRPALA